MSAPRPIDPLLSTDSGYQSEETEFLDYSSSLFTDSQIPEEESETTENCVLDTLSPWDIGTQVEETQMEEEADEVDDDFESGEPEIDWDLPENTLSFDVLCTLLPAYRTVYPKWKKEKLERKKRKLDMKNMLILEKKKEKYKQRLKDDQDEVKVIRIGLD